MTGVSISGVAGKGVYVKGNDIDTDRIIPARFLKCVTFDELGPSLFYDERFDGDSNSKRHPLDDPKHEGASILISDGNFGCGSSREHAPQALQKFGFRAVIAGSFADIFHGNCTTLGIPCIVMQEADRHRLGELIAADPDTEVVIDIEDMKVVCANESFDVTMKDSAREAFLAGTYDPLDILLASMDSIMATAERLGYANQR
jgi:3-isopropylmalate/(R)-2-methylmalate dehydratase small subunit